MPKQKTRKSALKRFKFTKTGKVLRRSSFARHLRRNKSKRQLRKFKTVSLVTGRIARRIRRLAARA
jgi:large subunit ribosomal protein L35